MTLTDNRYVNVDASTDWCGYTDVTIRVTASSGLWDESTFRVAVTWSCQGPLPVPDQAAPQGQPITLDLKEYEPQTGDGSAPLPWYGTEERHCTASGEYSADDVLTFTPEADFVGSDAVTLHMRHPWGVEARQALTLTWVEPSCDTPAAPILVKPVDGGSTRSRRPTFFWNAVAGADAYQIQVDDDADFLSRMEDEITSRTRTRFAPRLKGGTYYWCVRASNDCGDGAWWPVWEFEIRARSAGDPGECPVGEKKARQSAAIGIRWRLFLRWGCSQLEANTF